MRLYVHVPTSEKLFDRALMLQLVVIGSPLAGAVIVVRFVGLVNVTEYK